MPTRAHGTPRYCPAAECTRSVRAGYLMCAYHWRGVPLDFQRAVWRTWRAWGKEPTGEAWDAYREARAAALLSVGITP